MLACMLVPDWACGLTVSETLSNFRQIQYRSVCISCAQIQLVCVTIENDGNGRSDMVTDLLRSSGDWLDIFMSFCSARNGFVELVRFNLSKDVTFGLTCGGARGKEVKMAVSLPGETSSPSCA